MLKGNKAGREVMMDISGICSILDTGEHHGYAYGFVSAVQRDLPPYRFVDRAYPACWRTSIAHRRRTAAASGRVIRLAPCVVPT